MAKTIVTHINPDLDAITSVWLLIRFGGTDFRDAHFSFVPAGERLGKDDEQIVHVDTGLGMFDHHQKDRGREDTSASKLVYEWLIDEGKITKSEPLRRIVELVNQFDHFGEYFWPDPLEYRYEFFLGNLINGMKLGKYVSDDDQLVQFGMRCLDGILVSFKIRIAAEEALNTGIQFQTHWGKTIAIETTTNGVMKLALKSGYKLVARRNPETGIVRIKSAPLPEVNLTRVYEKLKKVDSQATWYFHPSGHMVLNGSLRNPTMRASKLSLSEVIEILKQAK